MKVRRWMVKVIGLVDQIYILWVYLGLVCMEKNYEVVLANPKLICD